MPDEWLYLRQLLGGSGQGWMQVSFLVFLFLVLVFKPERIYRLTLFKVACILFAVSIIATPVLTLLLALIADAVGASYRSSRSMMSQFPLLLSVIGMLGPMLFGTSILLAFIALFPPSDRQPRTEPAKHPLD